MKQGKIKPAWDSERLKASIKSKSHQDDSGCWIWDGAINSRGYGCIWNGETSKLAHRISYEVFVGKICGLLVCHECDVPCCVNPDHLFLGTDADNLNDCIAKERRGKILGEAKKQMIEMIRGGISRPKIAAHFNVDKTAIYYWVRKLNLKK